MISHTVALGGTKDSFTDQGAFADRPKASVTTACASVPVCIPSIMVVKARRLHNSVRCELNQLTVFLLRRMCIESLHMSRMAVTIGHHISDNTGK
jgi:hypothetical protein